MPTDAQIRNQLLQKIQRIPTDKLREINEFISKLEKPTHKKDKILSFAGAWKDMDDSLFTEFTEDFMNHREQPGKQMRETFD